MPFEIQSFSNENEKSTEYDLDALDLKISDTIQSLEADGLNMKKWNQEYENLPDDFADFREFYNRLNSFRLERQDALVTFEFDKFMTEAQKDKIRQFDQEVRNAYKDHDHFLGNGHTAEVYAMSGNGIVCVKFITNQDAYNENNTIRQEHDFLSKAYEGTKGCSIRTPYPIFLRVHPKEGHSYGMEKLPGASLSQILEFPEKNAHLVETAMRVDRQKIEDELKVFVDHLHEAGVTHGDLFKRNMMLDESGRLYVIDFGKAKSISFADDREDQRRSDHYLAKHSLREFFTKIDELTS